MPRIIKPAKGTFTAANITVDSSGRVVTAASGAAAANMILTGIHTAPQSGAQSNHVTSANTNKMHVYLRGGGGGGCRCYCRRRFCCWWPRCSGSRVRQRR